MPLARFTEVLRGQGLPAGAMLACQA
jgi:hypothetical protein